MKQIAGVRISKNKRLLLIHRIDKNHWELPGGKIKTGETKEETAIRETKEEIGCDIEIIEYLGFTDFKIKNETIRSHQFKAKIINGTPTIREKEYFNKIAYIDIEKEERLAPNIRVKLTR
ncbi:MAG: NUDIX hydrolase [Nanoarchaeota archaeon]|nr:NUDIX hydrolase [Nanoarchaeota archaeon]